MPQSQQPSGLTPPGSILNVGIPCVVTSGPTRFKATVRYLGEVLFDTGSYVGVEIPVSGNNLADALKWNDGSVDGVTVGT